MILKNEYFANDNDIDDDVQAMQFPECTKDGYHIGELMNFICLEQKCIQNSILCGVCVEQGHRTHRTRPIKLVVQSLIEQAAKAPDDTSERDELVYLVESSRNMVTSSLRQTLEFWTSQVKVIQEKYNKVFDQMREMILKKNLTGSKLRTLLESVIKDSEEGAELLNQNIQSVLEFLPEVRGKSAVVRNEDGEPIQDEEEQETAQQKLAIIKNQIMQFVDSARATLEAKQTEISKAITVHETSVDDLVGGLDVLNDVSTQKLVFSPVLHHPDITLLSEIQVKHSNGIMGYKMALLDMPLNNQNKKKFSLQISQSASSTAWCAFGVCNLKTIKDKNYIFAYSNIGHGAYMISSNGGSWSHHDINKNGQILAPSFNKGDVVTIEVDLKLQNIKFTNKTSNSSYSLDMVINDTDVFHPAISFYYLQDQVEVVTNV